MWNRKTVVVIGAILGIAAIVLIYSLFKEPNQIHDDQIDKKHYVLPNDQPIENLKCESAFKYLSDKEKLYTHYFTQASRYIGLVALIQSSPEAPLIYSLLHRIFKAETAEELKVSALAGGVSDDDITAFFVYASGFFSNAGNYKGSGDSKIVPNLSTEQFEVIIKSSQAYKLQTDVIAALWSKCKKPIFNLTELTKNIGLNGKGVTTYFSENCSKEDADRVTEWMKSKKMIAYNSRAFKTEVNGKVTYEIKLASTEQGQLDGVTMSPEDYNGYTFVVTRGDYSPILELVNAYLAEAKKYAANEDQIQMIEHYTKSFTIGSINEHKDATRFWIKDKGPAVETYMGFIAPYRDPAGTRAEFNSMVSIVNKETSEKFAILVKNAEMLLELMPWNTDFEKDVYLKPDFTSLEVLAFDSAMFPVGMSIPPYEDIRQNEGFKNVYLANSVTAHMGSKNNTSFLSEADQFLLKKYKIRSFEVQVALHELLGHGSGKLLSIDENGKFNFDNNTVINPLTNELVKTWYLPGETYVSKFGPIGPSYEECKSEAVGLYLGLNRDVLRIYGITDEQEIQDIIYVNWLTMARAGLVGLQLYNPLTKHWLQAHTQARYVLMQVFAQAGLIDVKETDDGKDLLLTLDRSKIETVGRKAISDFLLKLQIYKSTADAENGIKLYNHYSGVVDGDHFKWESWRNIVLMHRKPSNIIVQPNTERQESSNTAVLKTYESTLAGYIASCVDRFRSNDNTCNILESVWEENKKHFPSVIDK